MAVCLHAGEGRKIESKNKQAVNLENRNVILMIKQSCLLTEQFLEHSDNKMFRNWCFKHWIFSKFSYLVQCFWNQTDPFFCFQFSSVHSVTQWCLTLCDPMNRSMPGLPVHHQLPEFTQTQRPSSQWCHPAISSSVVPFSSCPQSLPASVFSNESPLRMRWPKYWSFSFSIISSKEIPGLISFRMDWLDLLEVQGTLKSLLQHHSSKASILRRSAFFTVQLSHPYMNTGKTIALTRWTFVGKSCLCFWICYLGWS